MSSREHFTSRWSFILSVLGIAVGTGNIWRFPRMVAANGGGSFLIPWLIFLFLWSIPLIMTELALGKMTRFGTIGTFASVMGKQFAWMGAFVGCVATAIMFYYSVVTGWCLRYLFLAGTGQLMGLDPLGYEETWRGFLGSYWQPLLFHLLAISAGAAVVQRGVVRGIERANRVLVPLLLALLAVSCLRAVTLPGAWQGLNYLFTPDLNSLADYKVWLQALTQNAWDTGAGWGLILTYGVYMKKREDVPLNAALVGLGNNSVSLLAAITIFCTVFALIPDTAAETLRAPGPANTGLTFIWMPQLFSQIPGGAFFSGCFFLALSLAALSSLISMIELSTRLLMDMKLSRSKALVAVYLSTLVLGIPSAVSTEFFLNQDWTWGVALILSGGFLAAAVIRHGAARFRRDRLNAPENNIRIGRWFDLQIHYLIPALAAVLITWWFSQVIQSDPNGWWNPLSSESVGTCLAQWGLLLVLLILANRSMAERSLTP